MSICLSLAINVRSPSGILTLAIPFQKARVIFPTVDIVSQVSRTDMLQPNLTYSLTSLHSGASEADILSQALVASESRPLRLGSRVWVTLTRSLVSDASY
jgi:hypothetical protein